ncbi:MAG: sigma-70 family RNA polymerase sigma factor [Clostridia bacterium]
MKVFQFKSKGCDNIKISYDKVLKEHSDLIYRIALANLKNKADAEDVFQDVFISLIHNENKIKSDTHLKYWLIRTTINKCKNLHLCFWKRNVNLLDENVSINNTNENEFILEVHEQIGVLPYKLKNIVYLYYFENYDIKEISKLLNIAEGTVKSRLHTARTKLKTNLKEISPNEYK